MRRIHFSRCTKQRISQRCVTGEPKEKSDDTARRGAGDRIVVYCNGDSYREKVVSKIRGGDVHAGLLVVSGTKELVFTNE